MSTELAKIYEPQEIEKTIYDRWIEAGAFAADPAADGDTFCMVIPPPNVTAALHLGHALNNTLQDVLIRWRRMQQYNTLWMPGTDHAGIATQTVVEKRLLAEEGKRRTEYEREDFVARVQDWKDEYEATILSQLQKMGCSCDWDRTRFTMDEVCAKAVRETFFRLFADGLIYRGKRLVNWDPATQTVLADDEVEHEEIRGHFWYLQYPLVEPVTLPSGPDTHGQDARATVITHITVATTRPETMLGDTAVAMNPKDPRAEYLVGKKVRLPIVGREIPIIADDHVVAPDPDSEDEKAKFSTGFLKVTPAHDPDDYQIGQRHDLPMINVMAPDGSISKDHGWDDWDTIANPDAENIIGMDRFEAREAIVEFFRQEKLLEDVRDYTHQVGHSYRSHVPIEPYLSDQWYVAVKKPIADFGFEIADFETLRNDGKVETKDGVEYIKDTDVPLASLAGLALAPLLSGRLTFTPDRYTRNYQTWLENLRDWPISRQLWWGHQIPVWSKAGDNTASLPGRVIGHLGQTDEGPVTFACVGPDADDIERQMQADGWQRDEDVLDTWFSSALWPFSTLGWPDETDALKTFYPGNVLSTAREIITLWVSRMVMMGQYCLGDIPFHDVFIHAMIQDGEGRKMSKSLGNGVDPLDIIASHGSDAMRYTLVSMTTQTQDVRMPLEKMTLPDGREVNSSPKFDIGRNFANKLWNAARFAMMKLQRVPDWGHIRPADSLADQWILSRLNDTIRDATAALDNYRFNELADKLYHFVWDDFCDWYLEIAKVRIAAGESQPKAVVAYVLDVILRLLHPIMPYITEAIWEHLNHIVPARGPGDIEAEAMLVTAEWPRADGEMINPGAEGAFNVFADCIREIRNVRMQHNVAPSEKVAAIAEIVEGHPSADILRENVEELKALAGLGELTISADPIEQPGNAAAINVAGIRLYVLDIIDVEAERKRLEKEKATLEKGVKGIEGKLSNENFVNKAPADVVQRERERLEGIRRDLTAVEDALAALG
jgi:valyl-tRNA synthetase